MLGGCGRLRSLLVPSTFQTGISKEMGWGGPKGARLGLFQKRAVRPMPLGPAAPQPVWALPSLPLLPRQLEERDSAHTGRGSPKGPCSCRVSTEKSDAVHESWKQAGERHSGMWRRQLNPRFWGSPGATQWAPPCMGREGAKRQEGGFPSALATPRP